MTWTVLSHFGFERLCKYQVAKPKVRTWPAITAMVPAIERAALELVPLLSTCHTQAIGSLGSMFFITVCRMKMPDNIPRNMVMSIRSCLIHRSTQSLLKSFTRASRVARFVAVDSSERSQMMKKWYGTMVFIFARPTDWMPIPVRICWSEKDWRSLRDMGAEVDLRRPRRIMAAERRMESMFVIIKDRSVCEVWGQ